MKKYYILQILISKERLEKFSKNLMLQCIGLKREKLSQL